MSNSTQPTIQMKWQGKKHDVIHITNFVFIHKNAVCEKRKKINDFHIKIVTTIAHTF